MYLLVGAPPLFLHNAMAVTIQKPDKVGTHTHNVLPLSHQFQLHLVPIDLSNTALRMNVSH